MEFSQEGSEEFVEQAEGENAALYVSFVSLPIFSHFEPLAAMAEEMFNRGYRVSIAIPEDYGDWVERYAPNAQFIPCGGVPDNEDLEETLSDATHQLRSLFVADGDKYAFKPQYGINVYDVSDSLGNDTSSINIFGSKWWKNILPNLDWQYSFSRRMAYYAKFQKYMLPVLKRAHAIDVPDLIVVDRYTFAGIGSAHYHRVKFVINSPTLLYDLDDPTYCVAAPLSGFPSLCSGTFENSMHTSTNSLSSGHRTLERSKSVHNRVKNFAYRLLNKANIDSIAANVQASWDMDSESEAMKDEHYYRNAFILVNSVIGIEDERMLPPLIAMVGDVSIPSDDTDDTISILANHETYTETSQEQILVFDRSICISDTLKKKLEAREDFVVYGITCDEQERVQDSPILLQNILAQVNASIVITTGYLGSVQKSLKYGVPVIVLPATEQDLDVGTRVERIGAGILLSDNYSRFIQNGNDVLPHACVDGAADDAFKCRLDHLIEMAIYNITSHRSFYRQAAVLKSKLNAGGGIGRAADILEAAMLIGVKPYVDFEIPWFSKLLLDLYILYIVVLVAIYMMSKSMISACYTLWNSVMNPNATW